MPLTPIDIQQKTFGPELRGYNMDEVDDFLDEVVAALKDYDQRVRDAQDRIRALEVELSTRGEDESAISRALVAAQKQADTLVADARTEAERIRLDAHDELSRLEAEREAERLSITQDIARMRATVADLKRRVVELASSAGSELDAMDEAAAGASAAVAGSYAGALVEDAGDDLDAFGDTRPAGDFTDDYEPADAAEEVDADDVYAELQDDLDGDDDTADFDEISADARGGQHMASGDDTDEFDMPGDTSDEDLGGDGEADLGEDLADDVTGETADELDLDDADVPPASRRPWERGSV